MGDIPYVPTVSPGNVESSSPGDVAGHSGPGEQIKAPEPGHPPQTQYQPPSTQHAFTAQLDMAQQAPGGRSGPYNMGQMANALPQMGFRPGQYPQPPQQRYHTASSPSMMPQVPQYAGHPSMTMAGQNYYIQQPQMPQMPQMPQFYGNQISTSQAQSPRQNMAYYPNQMMLNPPQSAYYYSAPQYQVPNHPMANTMMAGQYVNHSSMPNDHRVLSHSTDSLASHPLPAKQAQDGTERRQSAVRGPPRKPRQSGHAIWIGNLPPQTDLMSLVHHVCKEAQGLESLFLISKSNCAFANFKDESTCTTAQQKLHDSKFQSVRLVSRLRKSTVEGASGVTAPTGPAVGTTASGNQTDGVLENIAPEDGHLSPAPEHSKPAKQTPAVDGNQQKDKFFILKSLTVEDLELSMRTGIWATQAHNEEILNNAFKSVDSVYLVFSANKSGEYFGYARMLSPINEDPAAAIEFAPKAQSTNDLDLPKAIPTEATKYAPKGRIIDDSARGTIFWEVEREDGEGFSDAESDVSSGKSNGMEEGATKTWGKPFKLEWLSTTRLPFYRTRGLRNPWNSNREVKIARDGTELEPSVGRRLIGLFNRVQSPGPGPTGMRVPVAMLPGYPQMRPYGQ